MEKPTHFHSIQPATGLLALVAIAFLPLGCQQPQPYDGSSLDVRLTEANSVAEIKDSFRAVIARKYKSEDPSKGFSVYEVTNGSSRYAFVQAFNWPRGLDGFNLFCYEQTKPDLWLLRGLAPVNDYYYTNDYSREVGFVCDGEYVKAIHRGVVVFAVTGDTSQQHSTSHAGPR